MSDGVSCPFCHDTGFDLYGLKIHLTMQEWCPIFANLKDDLKPNQDEYMADDKRD